MPWTKTYKLVAFVPILCLCLSCGESQQEAIDGGPEPIRLDEILSTGEVRAGVISQNSELLTGREAHGWLGDFKMYNDRVAFIIENIDDPRGWGPFGGTVLDADRVRAADEAGEELFQQMIPMIDLATIKPTEAELVADGSDGQAAVLRIRGIHHGVPLVDGFVGQALLPKDLNITHEYILAPDVSYLKIRTTVFANGALAESLQIGDLVINGDHSLDFTPGAGIITEPVSDRVPYIAGFSQNVCHLYAKQEGDLGTMFSLEGHTPLVAADDIAPGRRDQDNPLVVERLLFVGEGGMDACLRLLAEVRADSDLGRVGGQVLNQNDQPEGQALVVAHDPAWPETADVVNLTFTDETGSFEMQLPFGDYQIEVRAEGREAFYSETLTVSADESLRQDFELPPPAWLAYQCSGQDLAGDESGPLPCKVSLQSGHDADKTAWVETSHLHFGLSGQGEFIVPTGDWTVTLSRGMEYSIFQQNITTVAGDTVEVAGLLVHQVDSGGMIAADLHSHCTRSADSKYDIKDMIASNMCEGVEVLVVTDHDCNTDFTPFVQELKQELDFDLDQYIRVVTGNEISPSFSHSTAFPMPTHPTGWVYWQVPLVLYEDNVFVRLLRIPEIWERVRELGARVINVAHPLSSAGYFNHLGFDPPEVMPRLDSLEAEKFSTDFDTMELLNSRSTSRMLDKNLPLWSNLNNQGLFRTAVGVSDSHHRLSPAGFGRTMVLSSVDQPSQIDLQEIWQNLIGRRAMVAGGIFVSIEVAGKSPGDLVSASGSFDIHLQVQAADWVPVAELQLLANGESIETLPLAEAGQLDPDQPALRLDTTVSVNPSLDTWYAAIASGDESDRLDPVFTGTRPVGMTNAVQVDVDGNGKFDHLQP